MKGFNNLGNTCYLNSGLQMLVQNQDLCNLIVTLSDKSTNLKELANFVKEYHDGKSGTLSPNFVKSLVSQRNSIFMGFQQQDSSEFIIFFLDFLNNEVNKAIGQNDNIIDKIFQIETTTSTKCKVLSCLNISTNIEKSTILMLDVNGESESLDDCYRLTKQKVKLEGSEKYFCEKCQKKRIASQRKEITSWPKNLVVWLRRFQQNGNRFSKYSQEIMVPVVWRHDYELVGVVYHSGSLHGGHYVYAGLVEGKWYLFDDSSVTELNHNSLARLVNNGYIYYYRKKYE